MKPKYTIYKELFVVKNNWRRELGKLMLMHFLWHSYYCKKSNEKKRGQSTRLEQMCNKGALVHASVFAFIWEYTGFFGCFLNKICQLKSSTVLCQLFSLIFCTSNYVIRLKRISTYTCVVDILTAFAKTPCHKWLFDISQYIKMSVHHCSPLKSV